MSRYNTLDIARFAEGDMDPMERIAFEEALEADADLQQELDNYRNVQRLLRMKLVEDEQDKAFKESLRNIQRTHFKEGAKVIPMSRYVIWTAIAAVFVLVLFWAPWNGNLYDQYSGTEMVAMAERGGSPTEEKMVKAAGLFNNKDFNGTKVLLEQVLKAEPDNSVARFYYGISLLETGEIASAKRNLLDLYQGQSALKYDALFYLALSYLKTGEKAQCADWLKKVPAEATNYHKAQELLKELE